MRRAAWTSTVITTANIHGIVRDRAAPSECETSAMQFAVRFVIGSLHWESADWLRCPRPWRRGGVTRLPAVSVATSIRFPDAHLANPVAGKFRVLDQCFYRHVAGNAIFVGYQKWQSGARGCVIFYYGILRDHPELAESLKRDSVGH